MNTPEDRLQALVDGQLPPAEAARLEAALSPEEARYVARQRALRARLAEDFALEHLPPPPDRLLRALEASAPGGGGAVIVRGPWRKPQTWALGAGWALAAALALAFLARGSEEAAMLRPSGGMLVAQGSLAEALQQDLSGGDFRQGPAGEARAIASFAAADGRICRLFETQGDATAHAGLACKEPSGWSVVALVEAPPMAEGVSGFRTASSGLPGLVLEAADSLRAGDPLDAAGERAAIAVGWR